MPTKIDHNTDTTGDRLSQLQQDWRRAMAQARQDLLAGAAGSQLTWQLAHALDTLVRRLVADAEHEYGRRYPGANTPYAVCAAGGWGREEVYPHSDVDLLFLHPSKRTPFLESLAESVLYDLWDLGFTVGHAVRNMQECIDLGRRDATIRTNLMDLRFVAGDRSVYQEAETTIDNRLHRWRVPAFCRTKVDEMRQRRRRYGKTLYLLEPNIKESPGGLRDVQTVIWIARVAFKTTDLRNLYQLGVLEQGDIRQLFHSYNALRKVRIGTHLEADRPQDRLTFGIQPAVAELFGFQDHDAELASEHLMRFCYEAMRETSQLVDQMTALILDRIEPRNRFRRSRRRPLEAGFFRYRDYLYGDVGTFARTPANLLRAFALSAKHDLPLSYELRRGLQRHAERLKKLAPEEQTETADIFAEIVLHPRAFETLSSMNETGVLRRYIPAFEHQYCRIQHDTYHIYTADVHLLFCLDAFVRLRHGHFAETEPELTDIAQTLADPLVTALAVLLHDIGKGYGVDHSRKGAELAATITQRLCLPPRRRREVAHLIRHHLLLSHTAQRRDLTDAAVIHQFAGTIGTRALLDALMVLTFCDQQGVGPGVWTPWKRSLMLQLYHDTRRVLEREDIQGIHRNRIQAKKKSLRKLLGDQVDSTLLERFLKQMPPRFFLRHSPSEARITLLALQAAEHKGIGVERFTDPETEATTVVISEHDRAGLFAAQAGRFRHAGMSIIDAEGYVLRDGGWVLNLFRVEPSDPLFFEQPERVADFLAKMHTDAPVDADTPIPPPAPRPRSRRQLRVRADTSLSRHFTIFEVRCWDRLGLLQELAEVFNRHHLDIALARIHTEGQRVSDTFYTRRREGGKTVSPDIIDQINRDLMKVIDDEQAA